ncbi:MAG: 3-deoxy-manno-octulosonate cytidylyltransferase [Bacteroidales bacterium]|nr:3-deoxy-manno-octulosonate cytidylyltransferase [Bacteroidales bacterium]
MKTRIIVIIPSRFASTRFPGKALANINGKAMILHVLDNALDAFDDVFVATDDKRIETVVRKAGGRAIMTGKHHLSGTERCAEAINLCGIATDSQTVIVNLQGDEPTLPADVLIQFADMFDNPKVNIATLVHRTDKPEIANNPNRVKVVMDRHQRALYFSRSPVPYLKANQTIAALRNWHLHLGVYAYRVETLLQLVRLRQTPLEISESLEQLRWLENGFTIHCGITDFTGFGIDTPDDLEKLNKQLR